MNNGNNQYRNKDFTTLIYAEQSISFFNTLYYYYCYCRSALTPKWTLASDNSRRYRSRESLPWLSPEVLGDLYGLRLSTGIQDSTRYPTGRRPVGCPMYTRLKARSFPIRTIWPSHRSSILWALISPMTLGSANSFSISLFLLSLKLPSTLLTDPSIFRSIYLSETKILIPFFWFRVYASHPYVKIGLIVVV